MTAAAEITIGGVSGGFVAERAEDGSCDGVMWKEDYPAQIHMLDGEGKVFIGISIGAGQIHGVVMTPDQADKVSADLQRLIAMARGAKGSA